MEFKDIYTIIGAIFIIKKLFSLGKWIFKHFIAKPINLKEKYGDGWVVITGGSDGIGLSFAKEFLKQNLKVCLIARNKDKLEQTKTKLQAEYANSSIKTITFDFNKHYNNDDISQIESAIKEATDDDISVLLNNVGYVAKGRLTELTNEEIHNAININIWAVTFISKIAWKAMEKRKRSLVVCSGAVMGRMRFASRQVYSSAKSYMEGWTECVDKEYPKVDFTYLNIGAVNTNFNRAKMPFTMEPDDFAKCAMNKLGKYLYTGGCVKHDLFDFLFWKIPIVKKLINTKMGMKKKID